MLSRNDEMSNRLSGCKNKGLGTKGWQGERQRAQAMFRPAPDGGAVAGAMDSHPNDFQAGAVTSSYEPAFVPGPKASLRRSAVSGAIWSFVESWISASRTYGIGEPGCS